MKNTSRFLTLVALFGLASAAQAALIAHYTFDAESGGTTADSVGTGNFATLGNRVQINTSVSGAIGGGALEMLGSGSTSGPGDGATTNNTFSWTSDARTVTFWWRSDDPNVNTSDGTFVSFGTEPGNGARFDIKEQHPSGPVDDMLRVEVQGTGLGTDPTNFDDGNWHFVAVTVPNEATFANISWFAGVRGGTLSSDLNTSSNTLAIATGTGPIAFGDSIVSTVTSAEATNDRVPNGYLDDFQLYDRVLTQEEILFLYNNPGDVIGASADPQITSFTAVGGGVWELTLEGDADTQYEFRSSTTLDFTPGTLVSPLSQANPGTDPGDVDVSGDFVTTDTNGDATVRLTLTGSPKDFVRAVSLP